MLFVSHSRHHPALNEEVIVVLIHLAITSSSWRDLNVSRSAKLADYDVNEACVALRYVRCDCDNGNDGVCVGELEDGECVWCVD